MKSINPARPRRSMVTGSLLPALSLSVLALVPVSAMARVRQDAAPAAPAPQAAPVAPTEAVSLTRNYKTGDVDHYKATVHAVASGGGENQEFTLNLVIKETIKDTKADGPTTLYDEFDKLEVNANGQDLDLTNNAPQITLTLDKTGLLSDLKADGGADMINSGLSQIVSLIARSSLSFHPGKAVKVGDTYKIDITDPKDKENTTTGTGTVQAYELVNGTPTYKIKVVTDSVAKVGLDPAGPKTSGKAHFEGVANLDPKTGKVVKMKGVGDGQAGPMGKIKSEIDYALVAPTTDIKKADAPK